MSSEIVGSQIVKTLKMFKKSFSHDKLMNLLNEIRVDQPSECPESREQCKI